MDEHVFRLETTWSGEANEGSLESQSHTLSVRYSGAPGLGGKPSLTNPEELLLSAIAACFVQTWAIFLKKLALPVPEPAIEVSGTVEKDPQGGYRFTHIEIVPHVPAGLLESQNEKVVKTLALAEKYCIVSKAVRGSVTLAVTPKPV